MKKLEISFLKNSKISLFQMGLGCGIIFCFLVTIPQVLNLSKVASNVAAKRKILSDLDNGMKNMMTLEEEVQSMKKAQRDFVRRLPLQKEFPVFLSLISKTAKKNNVKIIAIEPQKVVDDLTVFFVRIPITIEAYCGYHDLGQFLNDLEFSDKFMRIDTLKITADDTDSLKHQVLLVIYVFCLKEGMEGMYETAGA
ncbi:MAG: type 4a pilus biogenesis protein PilO [Candidatus Omnitrophica bacterium]|nr:type 4a pilus biogenesis protein PilO [Candidatus Omnitrophota bacterium]